MHQVLVGAGATDAITSMARRLRSSLRVEHASEIYAHYLDTGAVGDVIPLARLADGSPDDVLIYHASYGVPLITELPYKSR